MEILVINSLGKTGIVPALHFRFLTRYYDYISRAIGVGAALRDFQVGLLEDIKPGRILEVGCGTGELLRMAGRRFPDAKLVGLDADPEILDLARKKFEGEGIPAYWMLGHAQSVPFADASFDLVLSSLMLHHLRTGDKHRALSEWCRLLAPGGMLLLVDFGVPRSRILKVILWPMRFNLFEEQGDNFRGRVPQMLTEAGFVFEEAGWYHSVLAAYKAWPKGWG